ncbi:hypothetical protein GUJ93_ZPchr0012g20659 [Zizania palustris]|uniref:Uncharacterized protein n=1 Tax=Zizania palustris TaxID=103762 RepID=A0A8J5WV93_ZIZPA|nr:hypothetical protein GUJ93_ZPchr0012g20659 [Zizania palustris]
MPSCPIASSQGSKQAKQLGASASTLHLGPRAAQLQNSSTAAFSPFVACVCFFPIDFTQLCCLGLRGALWREATQQQQAHTAAIVDALKAAVEWLQQHVQRGTWQRLAELEQREENSKAPCGAWHLGAASHKRICAKRGTVRSAG